MVDGSLPEVAFEYYLRRRPQEESGMECPLCIHLRTKPHAAMAHSTDTIVRSSDANYILPNRTFVL